MSILNRKAYHEYNILSEFVAGIELVGSEVKSLRDANANISDSYIFISNNEVFVKNMYISKYKESSMQNHEERRDRRLLLTKREINRLSKELKVSGITIIPLEVFTMRGRFKMKIGVGRGKKLFDKKQSLKEKDIKRSTDRELNKW